MDRLSNDDGSKPQPAFMEHLQRALEEDLGEIAELAENRSHALTLEPAGASLTKAANLSQPFITSHFDNAISSLVSHCQHLEKNVYFKSKFPINEPKFFFTQQTAWQDERYVAKLHFKAYKEQQDIISGVGKVFAELDRCLTAAKFNLEPP